METVGYYEYLLKIVYRKQANKQITKDHRNLKMNRIGGGAVTGLIAAETLLFTVFLNALHDI